MDPDQDVCCLTFGRNRELWQLARSLEGGLIVKVTLTEDDRAAVVHLALADGRDIAIGAYGLLWEECYPVFREERATCQ